MLSGRGISTLFGMVSLAGVGSAALGVGLSQTSGVLGQFPAGFTMIFGKSPVVIAAIMAVPLNLILPKEKNESLMEIEVLRFRCPGLEDGGRFPLENTGRGKDLSPQIVLENLSPQAKTLAVTLEDMSHPIKDFTHWVMWNFPARKVIPGGLPKHERLESGAIQGIAYGLHRYAGPKPPPFIRHRYRLTVYALDRALGISANSRKRQFLKAAEGRVLQKGSLTAEFG